MGTEQRQYEFSGYRLDVVSRQLFGPAGGPIAVTPKALDVLAYLVRQHGRVVDRHELLSAVWPGRVVEENTLTQAISALRKAFGVGAGEHHYIVTLPGRGYRFVAELSRPAWQDRRQRVADAAEPRADAERFYLEGRDLVDAPSASRARRAIGMFRQALDLDPGYARAWSGQAFAWRALVMTGDVDPAQAFPLANAAVQHAIALDPALPEAHAAHAFNLFWYDWDWQGAELACRHAINLDPRVPDGHFAYAHLLNNLGRFGEALTQVRQARELDPLSPLINVQEGIFLGNAARLEEADARISHALDIAPDFWVALLARAGLAIARGVPAAAIDALEHAAKLSGHCTQVLALLGMVLAMSGERAGAERLREELRVRSVTAYVPGTSRAAISNALGYHEEALDLLELAHDQRDVRLTFLKVDAHWNNLRPLPRFVALMQRMRFNGEVDRAAGRS